LTVVDAVLCLFSFLMHSGVLLVVFDAFWWFLNGFVCLSVIFFLSGTMVGGKPAPMVAFLYAPQAGSLLGPAGRCRGTNLKSCNYVPRLAAPRPATPDLPQIRARALLCAAPWCRGLRSLRESVLFGGYGYFFPREVAGG